MSVPPLPVVRVTSATFNEWLRSGVYWLRNTDSVPAEDDIWVQLLPKFGGWRDSDLPVAALIDEVVAIALKTPELTDEQAIRLRNLGEDWLPYRYFTHSDNSGNSDEGTGLGDAASREFPTKGIGNTRPPDFELPVAGATQTESPETVAGAEHPSPMDTAACAPNGPAQGDTVQTSTGKPRSRKGKEQVRKSNRSGKKTQSGPAEKSEMDQSSLFSAPDAVEKPPESRG